MLHAIVTAIEQASLQVKSGDVLVIASKVLAYSQGLLKKINSDQDFRKLVQSESDLVLDEGDMILTIKNNILIPNAGIDRSNVPDGTAVLWPKNPFESTESLRQTLMSRFNLKEFGVVISDSHCQMLRMGTSGIAIAWAGIEGVQNEIGAKDLYGRKMLYTKIAVADNLASAANLEMGETDASVPFVLIRDAKVRFTNKSASKKDYFISPKKCIYHPFYNQILLNKKD